MNIFLKKLEMVQNDLKWVCIDSKSHPAKFGMPGTSKTAVIGRVRNRHNESRFLETLGTLLAHGHFGAYKRFA